MTGFKSIALADAIDLGDADGDVQSRKAQSHFVRHECAELSETKIIPIRFVENILGCVERIYHKAIGGGYETNMLQTRETDTSICNVVTIWNSNTAAWNIESRMPDRELYWDKIHSNWLPSQGALPPNIVSLSK